jgi:hypothetical protein
VDASITLAKKIPVIEITTCEHGQSIACADTRPYIGLVVTPNVKSSSASVLMMKATDMRNGDDVSKRCRFNGIDSDYASSSSTSGPSGVSGVSTPPTTPFQLISSKGAARELQAPLLKARPRSTLHV